MCRRFFGKRWKRPKPVEATLRNPPGLVIAEGDLVTLVWKRNLPEPTDKAKTYEAFWFDVMWSRTASSSSTGTTRRGDPRRDGTKLKSAV